MALQSRAQFSYTLPAYFVDFHHDPAVGNPSLFNTDNNYESNIHYKSFFGPYAELRAFHGNISFVSKERQLLSLRLQSEHEGAYFQRNRIQLAYAYELPLVNDWKVALSAYGGGIFYSYVSSGNFQGGQDQSIDLGLGIRFKNKNMQIGIASNQLNEAELQPLDYRFSISRFYEFYFQNNYRLNSQFKLHTQAKYRHTPQKHERIAQVLVFVSPTNEFYKVGLHYLHQRGLAPSFAVNVPYGISRKQAIEFCFSFFVANLSQEASLLSKQYDLSLKWRFKK